MASARAVGVRSVHCGGSTWGFEGGVRKLKVSCTHYLLLRGRFVDKPSQQSVDYGTGVQQLGKRAQGIERGGAGLRSVVLVGRIEIGPLCRDQCTTPVREDEHKVQTTASTVPAQHFEGQPLTGMAFAGDRYFGRKTLEVGSVSWFPLTW